MSNGLEQIDHWILRFDRISGVADEVARRAAPKIAALVAEEFADGHDAYGKSWKPLAPATTHRGRHAPPLTDSGTLRASVQITAQGPAIQARVDAPAQSHQTGTSTMPARPVLPTVGAPERWKAVLADTTREVLDEVMSK